MDKFLFEEEIIDDSEIEDSGRIIPILSDEDGLIDDDTTYPDNMPILPLRNSVLFPGVIMPVSIGRKKSLKLLQNAYKREMPIGTVLQKDEKIETPTMDDLYKVGTVATILKILEMPDGSRTAILQGKRRFALDDILFNEPYHVGRIHVLDEMPAEKNNSEFNAIVESIRDMATKIVKLSGNNNMVGEALFAMKNIESALFLINFVASNSGVDFTAKQDLLETDNPKERASKLLELLSKQMSLLQLKHEIQDRVKGELDKQQREYFLHQQIKTIQDELGDNPSDVEIEELEQAGKDKMRDKLWSEEVNACFLKEIAKLKRLNPTSPDYSVQCNYLREMLDLPWNLCSEDNLNIKHAEKILNEDHYGLEKVKERILEYVAVLKLKADMKSPILCLYGPPGVGKTSLGQSVARAIGRKYVRMSLGGVYDEAEIRGHRRTYIGSMMGRILQNIKKAGTSNPVFILDEIDKVGRDVHGDPQSALLEVLDPEQNSAFHDNFLDIDYDLSKVMFIATANDLSTIAPALRDRLEVIDVNGYLAEEKREIAIRHLIGKQLANHGVSPENVTFPPHIIDLIIEKYTRESGVRMLDKAIAKIVRQVARKVASNKSYSVVLDEKKIEEFLGAPIFLREEYQGNELPGVVTGLAWTASGGEILFVEASVSKGKGQLTMTGNLGDVMKESATIALEYIKSHADSLNIPEDILEERNIHIHVPEGAVPKDGPSAGITMVTAMVSALSDRRVKRAIAMTGEMTLRGKVLPVGGIREKVLAAKRSGIKEIILCEENKKDIEEIKREYLRGLKFHYVNNIDEVLKIALLK